MSEAHELWQERVGEAKRKFAARDISEARFRAIMERLGFRGQELDAEIALGKMEREMGKPWRLGPKAEDQKGTFWPINYLNQTVALALDPVKGMNIVEKLNRDEVAR